MRISLARLFLIVSMLFVSAPAFAWQEQPAAEEIAEPDAELSASEQAVGVNDQVDDTRISDRLREVLEATERFSTIEVDVHEGVAFLTGATEYEESRSLAGDLARRTEGVVAVVNNITIEQGPIWTLEPAKRELALLWREIVGTGPLVGVGLVVLVLTFFLAALAQRLVGPVLGRTTDSDLLHGVLRKTVYVFVLIIGFYIALRISGLTRLALTVVSGTGIIGLILGFAFRDIAENFLASLLLSIQRPFRLGDVIQVEDNTGVVRKVTSRGTLLIDFDGNHIQIANATVYKSTIRNYTANPKRRLTFTVGVGYDDDVARAQELLRVTLKKHPAVLDDPKPLVLIEELGASTINLRAYYWIDGTKHSMLKVTSSTMRRAKAALTEEGISMPDESREVIFPQGVPVRMLEGDAAEAVQPRQKPVPPPTPDTADTAIDAEGDLGSETADLERQADESRDPEEGANVLEGDRPERAQDM